MRAAGKRPGSHPGIPMVKLSLWLATGPSGDCQEQLSDMMRGGGARTRRRLQRALDDLTVRWALNDLPDACRWLLNTQALFLIKSREPTCKEFDDEEWLRAAANGEWAEDIRESEVESYGPEVQVGEDISMNDASASGQVGVRPIQMGEFLRKLVAKRLLLLNKGDIGKVMHAMRQLGVGMPGGAESLAIFHQLLHELWREGALTRPLARVKIDERNCFGRLEWHAVREASRQTLPRHFPVACWKHAAASYVEQADVEATPKDRGAEQGDVDGPAECSMTLGVVAAETRTSVHEQQRRGELPWLVRSHDAAHEAARDFDDRRERTTQWRAAPPAQRREGDGTGPIVTDPLHEVQFGGGLADFWYLDDGDVLCDARLVLPYLASFDVANPKVGGERNGLKTEVVYYVEESVLQTHAAEWRLEEVRGLASVSTAAEPGLTLGVAVGSQAAVEAQLRQKQQVVRAMRERVTVAHDVQTEHVLNRECPGIGRVNHILRVHGDQLFRSGDALAAFDAGAAKELNRLFPGLPEEAVEQASLTPALGGLGWRRATETARPANLAALMMAGPKVRHMAACSVRAGLLDEGQVEERLEAKLRQVEVAFLQGLDEAERVKAESFLVKARRAAEEQWAQIVAGSARAPQAPVADTAYIGEDDHHVPGPAPHHEDGEADVESNGRSITVPHLQRELCKLQDCCRLRALEGKLRLQSNWPQLEALKDLRHPEVSHKWLWHLDTRRGSVLAPCDYVVDVQRRLGARLIQGEMSCRLCGAPLDPQLVHSECCDTAGATRGHYAVVRPLLDGLKLADPAATTEPRGLTTTQSRPADVLTTAAVPGRSAALDVCVASPNAAAASGDAAEAAFRRKLRRYRQEIRELAAAGILYRPMVWTSNGRPHPAVTRTLHFAAAQAANRSEQDAEAKQLLARWRHEIQIAIQRRRAAMTRAVQRRAGARAMWLLSGHSGSVPTSEHRAPPMEPEIRDQTEAEEEELRDEDEDSGSDASGD